jgi:hypothetical protein
MRVRIDVPALLPDLCDYLSQRGFVAFEVGVDEAKVTLPNAPSEFEAAALLLADVDLWRAQHVWAHVAVDPGQA